MFPFTRVTFWVPNFDLHPSDPGASGGIYRPAELASWEARGVNLGQNGSFARWAPGSSFAGDAELEARHRQCRRSA